jgi:hypothetical protein
MNRAEMREKIARILIDASVDNEVFATTAHRIQSLYDSEGWVKKAENQELPTNPYPRPDQYTDRREMANFAESEAYERGQQSMLDAGYVLIEKAER